MTVERMRRDIREAEQYAAALTRLLAEAVVPDDLRAHVERAGDQAGQTFRAAVHPYSIGVLGEFSAGKTMFIASLLGLDGLAIGDRPVTGNVTGYWVRQGPEGEPVEITGRGVCYLTEHAVNDRRRLFGDQLVVAGKALRGPMAMGFEAIVRDAAAREGNPRALRRWLDDNAADAPNEVTRLAAQLVAVTRSAHAERHRLGQTERIETADEWNRLVLIGEAAEPGPFWVVDHAVVHVSVPRAILDLDAVVGEAAWSHDATNADRLVIYDFPGFLNDVSGERDLTLTKTMLPRMDAVVTLLKAMNADGQAADELSKLLHEVLSEERRGRLFAGVGNLSDLNEGLRFTSSALRHVSGEDQVLAEIPTLAKLLRTADGLSPDDDPFLYSGLVALDRMGLGGAFDERLDLARRVVEGAGEVGARLPQTSRLRGQLLAVAHDGGRAHVLERLTDRLAAYGLPARHQRVAKERRELDRSVTDLKAALEQRSEQSHVSAMTEVDDRFARLTSALFAVRREVPEILLDVMVNGDGRGPALVEEIRGDIADRVFGWHQWWQALSSASGTELKEGPVKSDDLLDLFTGVCHKAYETARARALERWERAVVESAKREISDDVQIFAGSLELSGKHRQWLDLATEPDKWRGILTAQPETAPLPEKGNVDLAFPLRRPHMFAWAIPPRDRPSEDEAWFLHQLHPVHLVRLRHELIRAADAVVSDWIDALRPTAAELVRRRLVRIDGWVSRVRRAMGPPQQAGHTTPLLAELEKLIADNRPSGISGSAVDWDDDGEDVEDL